MEDKNSSYLFIAGFRVNNSTMQALVYRYADERSNVSLDNYLICLAKLMKLFSKYNI